MLHKFGGFGLNKDSCLIFCETQVGDGRRLISDKVMIVVASRDFRKRIILKFSHLRVKEGD